MPGFLDYLRQRKPVAPTTQPVAPPASSSSSWNVGDYSLVLGRNLTEADFQPGGAAAPSASVTGTKIGPNGELLYPVYNPSTGQLVEYRADPGRTAGDAASDAYNQQWESLRQQLASGQITPEQFRAGLEANTQQYRPTPSGQSTQNPGEVPPRTDRPLDIYNPGPYLADILRKQLPGYVFGTRVPTPSQVTLSEFLRLLPTEREQVLPAYVSALGVEPADFFSEMQRYWLNGGPYRRVAWGS